MQLEGCSVASAPSSSSSRAAAATSTPVEAASKLFASFFKPASTAPNAAAAATANAAAATDDDDDSCIGYDASASPCTPLFAPPERFIDLEHPWAFDVWSAAVTFLRLCWPAVDDDDKLQAFLLQLERAGATGGGGGGLQKFPGGGGSSTNCTPAFLGTIVLMLRRLVF